MKRRIRYELIKSQIVHILQYEKQISKDPSLTDEQKVAKYEHNNNSGMIIIESLFESEE